jgi:tetratricopeptide (TPR) repeat protein
MTTSARVALLGMLVVAVPVAARDIHYGAVSHPALDSCDAEQWRGQREAADRCYRELLQSDAPAEIRAEAAWALNDMQLANRLFRQAAADMPDDAGIMVRWGDLFADSHQDGEAMNIYREALALDDTNDYAYLGAARVLVGGFDDAANTYLEPLLSDATRNDGARAAAWLLVARISLENGDQSQAADALDTAETIITANDLPPLELYALRASADLLNNVTESRFTAMSLEYNPHYGGIYAIPAHFYVITRRYREAIDMYQRAVDIEPTLAPAHEELGINLLRDNQVSRARRHLEIAYSEDPFSPQAVNTLRLLDSFDNFSLVHDPDHPQPGILPITLRLHDDEAAAIAPYAIKLTRDSIDVFTERYGFTLQEPVIVEMYPDHEDFAVRTAGMPGIGILGATFGYVVAMDSPSARPTSQFQWGTTLWHEMAHVFTLEATNHLVPRWFSEGVSVFEEWQSGPTPGVRIPMSVYGAMSDDKFLPIAELDEGFIRPTYEEQVIVSYMQAGLVCQFINDEFGEHKLRELLSAFGDGLDTDEAISRVFQQSPTDFDDAFDAFVTREHGAIIDNLDDWQRTHQSIGERVIEEEWDAIIDLAVHSIDLLPWYVEPDSAYIALARAYDELDRRDEATTTLLRFWRTGGYDPGTLRQLGSWLNEAGRTNEAIDVLQTVNLVDPLDQSLHGELGDLLMDADRAAEALLEYTVALALDPHDKATAHYRVATAHHALGDSSASQAQLLMALDVAPNYRPAQRLLLELMRTEVGSERN